jgi:hypothetical protein
MKFNSNVLTTIGSGFSNSIKRSKASTAFCFVFGLAPKHFSIKTGAKVPACLKFKKKKQK